MPLTPGAPPKLDLYGYKFYVVHVLRQTWAMPRLIRPRKTSRLPDTVTVQQTQALLPGTYFLITFTLPAELRPWPGAISKRSMAW